MIQSPDLTPSGSGAQQVGSLSPEDGPVKQARLLLPLWGEQFIIQFLRISLPTLLASGNLPAVAAAVPSTLVFLTNTEGAELLRGHPAVVYLRTICGVEFDLIDDLITGDNYSTTLTLAYARAVRAPGEAMRDTAFFFLISDYIMADGSLLNVLRRLQSGYTGILAGNFQVIEEEAKEPLFEKFESDDVAVTIGARELVRWALDYLHPMTLANMVNFPIYNSAHSNRLFWRVDADTLIGRFYLMHMIAIRPEILEFQVGASCDYSFVPEMCPSGNVHVMTESDEYLVVEMQRRGHEGQFLRLGSMVPGDLATTLAEWTTARHRLNAHFPVVYRTSESSPTMPVAIEESRLFIEAIEAELPGPQPYRDHPYWIGAIAAHRREVARRRQKAAQQTVDDDVPLAANPVYHNLLFRIRDFLFGKPTKAWPWHPRWPDYQMVQTLAEQYLIKNVQGRSLVLSSTPALFQEWLGGPLRAIDLLNVHRMLRYEAERYDRLLGRFDGCLLVLTESEFAHFADILDRVRPLLGVGDYLLVFVMNGQALRVGWEFNEHIVRSGNGFVDRHLAIEQAVFVTAGSSSWTALRGLRKLFGLSMRNPLFLLLTALPIVLLMLFSTIGNIVGRRKGSRSTGFALCSSMGVVMRVVVPSTERPEPKDSTELKLSRQRFAKVVKASERIGAA